MWPPVILQLKLWSWLAHNSTAINRQHKQLSRVMNIYEFSTLWNFIILASFSFEIFTCEVVQNWLSRSIYGESTISLWHFNSNQYISTSSTQNTAFPSLKNSEIEVFNEENCLLSMIQRMKFYINWWVIYSWSKMAI